MRHLVTSPATIPILGMGERTLYGQMEFVPVSPHLTYLYLLLGLILSSVAEEMVLDQPDLSVLVTKRDRKEKRNLSVLMWQTVLKALLLAK